MPGAFLAFSLLPGIRRTVTLWLSGVVVDRTFTLGGVDMREQAYLLIVDKCFYSRVKFSRLVLTAKLF